jgi:hypothetical protein
MSTSNKRMACKTRKAPLVQAGEWVVEGTRFLFASIVLVYLLALVSFQEVTTARMAWNQTFESSEWSEALLLELKPVLNLSDSTQAQRRKNSSEFSRTIPIQTSERA